jgi:hypothetical protein
MKSIIKKYISPLALLGLLFIVGACSNDFLKENTDASSIVESVIYVAPGWDEAEWSVNQPAAQNSRYKVMSAPEWLRLASTTGVFSKGVATLKCSATEKKEFSNIGLYNDVIVLEVDNLGKILVPVFYINEGNPMMEVLPTDLTLDDSNGYEAELVIRNVDVGVLFLAILDKPSWVEFIDLELSDNMLPPNSMTTLRIRYSPESGLTKDTDGQILIAGNDRRQPQHVVNIHYKHEGDKEQGGGNEQGANPEDIRAVEGAVTDASFDPNRGLLYLCTSQPNRILAYDPKSRSVVRQVDLAKAPTCFSPSEDWKKAIVGHGGMISFVDLENFNITHTKDIQTNVYDIEWGLNNWFCYTSKVGQWVSLQWENESTHESLGNQIYEKTIIKRIPNQNYIVASQLSLSPSGITVFDMKSKKENSYFHEDIGMFWFSTDGEYLFDMNGNVYRTQYLSTQSESSINYPPMDNLKYGFPFRLTWLDHQATNNRLWALYEKWYEFQPEVLQFETNDYTFVRKYSYGNYYHATINGQAANYKTQAHYVFATGANEIVVIKNILPEYNAQAWSIEHIAVQ